MSSDIHCHQHVHNIRFPVSFKMFSSFKIKPQWEVRFSWASIDCLQARHFLKQLLIRGVPRLKCVCIAETFQVRLSMSLAHLTPVYSFIADGCTPFSHTSSRKSTLITCWLYFTFWKWFHVKDIDICTWSVNVIFRWTVSYTHHGMFFFFIRNLQVHFEIGLSRCERSHCSFHIDNDECFVACSHSHDARISFLWWFKCFLNGFSYSDVLDAQCSLNFNA